jgi:PAS domain S-box-containing protein
MFENSKNSRNPAGGIDAVNELTTENSLREIRLSIEKSSSLHIEFWSQLSEDTPDLGKLYEVGTLMMYVDSLLEDTWKRILKMNIDVPPNLMMVYSRYLVDILYDKERADEVLERLKNFYSVNVDRGKITNNINDFPNESTALISISAEDLTFARIIGLNMSASKMFGYSKSELINRKVNMIMPNIFAKQHDFFLETYLSTFESRLLNRERPIFGKSKNGYMFPFVIYVRFVPSFIHGTQFFGVMRQEKIFKTVGFMIVDGQSLEIENITSNFMSMFRIDLNFITKKKIKVMELIPDFQTNINDYLSK